MVDGAFDALAEGDPVEVALDSGDSEKGPHASAVRPISGARFVSRMG